MPKHIRSLRLAPSEVSEDVDRAVGIKLRLEPSQPLMPRSGHDPYLAHQ
jgi:hypothetical protein